MIMLANFEDMIEPIEDETLEEFTKRFIRNEDMKTKIPFFALRYQHARMMWQNYQDKKK